MDIRAEIPDLHSIPYLPRELREVPPAPDSASDPESDTKRARWLAWREDVKRYRITRRHELEANPTLIAGELIRCQDPCYWICVWGVIFEPRKRSIGRGSIAFVLTQKQVEVIRTMQWSLQQDDESADIAWEKSRGWGASWTICAFAIHQWLFEPSTSILLLSRKQEYVDSKQSRSLFWKIRFMRDQCPPWMLPHNFDLKEHQNVNLLVNPENGNQIGGEAMTGESGRGDRVTWAFIDEAAYYRDFQDTWDGLSDTTDHRWCASTVSFKYHGNFDRLCRADDLEYKPVRIVTDWFENPILDAGWLEKQRRRASSNPGSFEREIMRDPIAGTSGWVYEKAWTLKLESRPEPRQQTAYIAIDPGRRDDTAIIVAAMDGPDLVIHGGYAKTGPVSDYYGTILTSAPEDRFTYHQREHEFMEWLAEISPNRIYVGDTYGDNEFGVTNDTFYSRLYQHYNIPVNRDRRGVKDTSMGTRQNRLFRGRREAVSKWLNDDRLHFGNGPGAADVLHAIKNSRYEVEDKPVAEEKKTPLHDDTSHYRSALEFLCVYLRRFEGNIVEAIEQRAEQPAALRPVNATLSLPKRPGTPRARLYLPRSA